MNQYLNRGWHFWRYVFKHFFANKASYQAAALTYASLLAIVPLFAVVLKVFSLLPIYKVMTNQVETYVYENFVLVNGSLLHQYLTNFTQQASHLPMVGSIFLIVMVITVLATLEKVFSCIWHVPPVAFKLKNLLSYWVGLLIPIPILLATLLIISVFISLPLMAYSIPLISVQLLVVLPFILAVLGFSALYYLVPNCKVQFIHALISGLFTTVLLTLTKNLLTWYLTHFSVYQLIYGAFAVIPIILLWFYVIWLITLLGAEVCHALGYSHEHS
jgi:membrane protein